MKLLKVLAYCVFISLATGSFESASAKHAYQSPHPHLEPIIQDFLRFSNIDWESILPTVRGILREHSDLIKNLQEAETHSDFLPYIAEYETLKGSPMNPDIRIFLYDGSKLPLNHLYQINHARGVCFSGLNFIFMDIRYWSTTDSRIILDRQMQNLILDSYANGEIVLSNRLWQLMGRAYKSMSDEERDARKQESVRLEEEKEERLSDMEKLARRDFLRRIDLFHELGHCDLNRRHEDHDNSIMGRNFVAYINRVMSEEYPDMNLDDFFESFIDEFFSKRDTLYTTYSDSGGISLLKLIRRLNPFTYMFNSPESEAMSYIRRSLEDLDYLNDIMLTDDEISL